MELTKIVITGGPCAGKSTALAEIKKIFSPLGYTVVFVPETATELISGGIAPWTCGTPRDYQVCQMKLQIEKEQLFEKAARSMHAEKILLVCDRGSLDSRAYMTEDTFQEMLRFLDTDEVTLRDSYDAVFHLVTAAKGACEAYTTANNSARTETPEQAAVLDDRVLAAWVGHPHLRVIDNRTDFPGKLRRLTDEIALFLGEPENCEIERKFLIEYPDLKALTSTPFCKGLEILQTYLKSPADEECRIRRRGTDGHYIFFKTVKRKLTDTRRIETEERITKEEYLNLLSDADPTGHPVRKTRYCLMYDGQYFEIDLYPFWNDRAILEIELKNENDAIRFPPQIRILREVTDDPSYKNAALARIDSPLT